MEIQKLQKNLQGGYLESDPSDHASYVLSNLYSGEEKWEQAFMLRQRMVEIGVKKDPGSSWLIFRDQVHEFLVGNFSRHDMMDILGELRILNKHINSTGSWHVSVDC